MCDFNELPSPYAYVHLQQQGTPMEMAFLEPANGEQCDNPEDAILQQANESLITLPDPVLRLCTAVARHQQYTTMTHAVC